MSWKQNTQKSFETIYQIYPHIWIMKAKESCICVVSNEEIEEDSMCIGIEYENGTFNPIKFSQLETFVDNLRPTRVGSTSYIKLVENIPMASCPRDCLVCGEGCDSYESVLLLSDSYSGTLDAWVHPSKCLRKFREKLTELSESDLSKYHPQIVSRLV